MAAVAVAVFNPQFLYTAVSITNDGWAAGAVALVLATAAQATLRTGFAAGWSWVGLALGLASLTKYSALVVAVPVGLLWLELIGHAAAGVRRLVLAAWWAAAFCCWQAGGLCAISCCTVRLCRSTAWPQCSRDHAPAAFLTICARR